MKRLKPFNKKTGIFEASLLSELGFLSPLIVNTIGGAISYLIQGLISYIIQGSAGYTYRMSILSALTVAPFVGIIAGFWYSFLGLPASLVFEKSKRFQNWKHEYIKSIIRAEVTIIVATVILAILALIYNLIGPPTAYMPPSLIFRISIEVLLIFSTFPLIGSTVKEGLKKTGKALSAK